MIFQIFVDNHFSFETSQFWAVQLKTEVILGKCHLRIISLVRVQVYFITGALGSGSVHYIHKLMRL